MSTVPRPTLYALPKRVVDALPWESLPGCSGVRHKVVFRGDGVVTGLLLLDPGAEEVPHLHGHGDHHLWVLEGGVEVEETPLPSGSYLHVPGGLLHGMRDSGMGSLLFYVFSGGS
jgi:mannose-6-phosphate isomerase-like protein (cupin superfamily)